MTVGEFIRMKREAKGWTQTEMSYQARVPANLISKWETGHGEPNVRNLERLAPVLDFELPWMQEMAQTRATRRLLPSLPSHASYAAAS